MFLVKRFEKNILEDFGKNLQDLQEVIFKVEQLSRDINPAELFVDGLLLGNEAPFKRTESALKSISKEIDDEALKGLIIAYALINNSAFKKIASYIASQNYDEEFNFNEAQDILRFIDSLYFNEELLNELLEIAILSMAIHFDELPSWKFEIEDQED